MNKKWLILGTVSFGVAFGIGFVISKDLKRSALTGLTALPATIVSVSVIEHQRKRQLNDRISSLQTQENKLSDRLSLLQSHIESLTQQESNLKQSLSDQTVEQKQLTNTLTNLQGDKQELKQAIALLQTNLHQLETQFVDRQQQKLILEEEIADLEAKQQNDTAEYEQLVNQIKDLQQQKIQLDRSLDEISDRKQQLQKQVEGLQDRVTDLNEQVKYKQQIEEAIALLQTNLHQLEDRIRELDSTITEKSDRKRQLETFCSNLQNERDRLEIQIIDLDEKVKRKQQLEQNISLLQTDSHQLENQIRELDITITEKSDLKQNLEAECKRLQDKIEELKRQITIIIEPPIVPPPVLPLIKIPDPYGTSIDAEYINNVWEKIIYPYWNHRDRPQGRRFLGSIPIQQSGSDKLLNLVGKSLQGFYQGITYNGLENRFGGYYLGKKNWIKFFTFLISEYAYLYSEKDIGFWRGLCQKLNIRHSSGLEDIFRQVISEGIESLGLVRATGGYEYISTLWLQNGVPVRNLEHFSQLLQATANEYGWWEISHSEPKDIAELLLKDCQQKYPNWRTLAHFLKASYSETEEFEPISGELVRGIARVAQALQQEKLPVHILENYHERQKIIEDYPLPQNFFLRDWKTLIKVLAPKAGSGNRIVSRRTRSLFLILDIANTGKTKLILPEQKIWKKDWNKLRGTYCLIPKANWESNIPTVGDLEIPELAIDIEQTKEVWSCELLNHYQNSIHEWKSQGINSQFPCLIFDAISGNHLSIDLSHPQISGVEEIICFTPKDVITDFGKGIEILDRHIPSSIKGWRGQQVRLTELTSSIILTLPDTKQSQKISWKRHEDKEPTLTGLRLKENKPIDIYIETPTFWYPPQKQEIILNILIENLTERVIVEKTIQTLQPNNDWLAIPLNRWIAKPGKYEVCFWVNYDRWTYRFEFQENYQISAISNLKQPPIISLSGNIKNQFPIHFNRSDKFWAEIIKVEQLWTLEKVLFILSNGEEQVPYQVQADTSGSLTLNLSVLYDLLPRSNRYVLSYQRLGLKTRRLLECNSQ